MSQLALYLLGLPRIELDDVPIQLDRRKALALLIYLAMNPQPHSRDALATLFWPGYDQTYARANLRRTLSALNQALGKKWLEVERESITLPRNDELWVDVAQFRSLLTACEAHGHPKSEVCPACLTPLSEAVALYHDDFLTHATQEAYKPALAYARRWLALNPLHEPAQRRLMQLYVQAGDPAAALRQYQECVRLLEKELGVAPSVETTELFEAIKAKRPSSPPVAPAEKPETRTIEPDISPENFFPAPLLQPSPPMPPHNLPLQLTSFIGREKEIAEVKRLLPPLSLWEKAQGVRLVTLTGAGGVGKTRLSLQVATELLDVFPNGVWLVELAALADPALVVQTVAAALGLREDMGRPMLDILIDHLRAKTALLILDNCEHLAEACAQLTEMLLHQCPNLRVLVSSREALGVPGERVYRVPSLSFPLPHPPVSDLQSLVQYEATRLFIERAATALPGFSVTKDNASAIAQICYRLDGIPLAIELAAARIQMLRVEQIAMRLDDRFRLLTGGSRTALPRHQTLRALIDWSYDLLSEPERALLRRLSVFAGGWTLEAAEAITDFGFWIL
ncbi:MAG: AAA family ATPase, partial [Chloroflexi bacterium]|nr:AAA family ATPase [Chloroflexota bacterium]